MPSSASSIKKPWDAIRIVIPKSLSETIELNLARNEVGAATWSQFASLAIRSLLMMLRAIRQGETICAYDDTGYRVLDLPFDFKPQNLTVRNQREAQEAPPKVPIKPSGLISHVTAVPRER
ncbi:MAG: hypothetical protein WCI47_01435 [bacterium]